MTEASETEPASVLVVTADSDYADACKTELEARDGLRIVTATTVAEAVEVLQNRDSVECVVSDHDTPDVDAIAFLEAVRLNYVDLPFILFTSEGSELVASRAIHAGVTDYLIKERYRDQWDQLTALLAQTIDYYRTHRTTTDPEARRPALFEAMPDMVAILRDDRVEYVNAAGVDLLGLETADELVGAHFHELFPERNEATTAKLRGVQRGDRLIGSVSERLTDVSGIEIPVDVTGARLSWEGEPATVVIVSDRSERASLQQRLHRVARMNSVVREINHLIIRASSREEIEREACERLMEVGHYSLVWIGGYDPDTGRVEKRAAAGVATPYLDDVQITVGDEPTGQGPTGRAISTGAIQVTQDFDAESAMAPWREAAEEFGLRSSVAVPLTVDGTRYGVLNVYSDESHDFNAVEENTLELLGTDIAFAIRALAVRDELEQSEERLLLALNAANAGVWDWNIDENTLVWDENMEALFGLEPGAFEGTYEGFAARLHDEDLPRVERALERAVAEASRFESEFRIRRDDGVQKWLRGEGEVITDDRGEPTRVLGVCVDITSLKERDQHLQIVDRVLRHNLRNDLNVITGRAETIRDQTSDEIAAQAETIVTHSENLLSTAAKERTIVELLSESSTYETVSLAALVDETVTALAAEYPAATLEAAVSSDGRATVSRRFNVAVEELVENAIVHSDRDHPAVRVELESGPDTIALRVVDDGPPIPEMNIGVLTEGGETPLYHGSGLGLWLVHWIVQRSHGQITFEERDPRGNAITVQLPRAEPTR